MNPKYETYTGIMPLMKMGMRGARTLTDWLPRLIHSLLKSKCTDVEEIFLHNSRKKKKLDIYPSNLKFCGRNIIQKTLERYTDSESNQQQRKQNYLLLTQVNPQLNNYTTTIRIFKYAKNRTEDIYTWIYEKKMIL